MQHWMSALSTFFFLCTKVLFLLAIPIQAMLWPNVMSICFVCIYGIINIMMYYNVESGKAWEAVLSTGIFVFRGEKKPYYYALMIVVFAYFAVYFVAFVTQEAQLLPTSTFWLHPSIAANYTVQSFTDLPVDVKSTTSQDMRNNPFTWYKTVQVLHFLFSGYETQAMLTVLAGGCPFGARNHPQGGSQWRPFAVRIDPRFQVLWQALDSPSPRMGGSKPGHHLRPPCQPVL